MLNPTEAIQEILKFASALAIATGLATWRRGGPQEDKTVAESCDLVIDTIANADKVNTIDRSTGKNLRDQISLGELEELNRERQDRRFTRRN